MRSKILFGVLDAVAPVMNSSQGVVEAQFAVIIRKLALVAVFDIDQVYMKPVHNLMSNLLYAACGSDVCMTMVDGKVLYDDGEFLTLDIEKIYYEA